MQAVVENSYLGAAGALQIPAVAKRDTLPADAVCSLLSKVIAKALNDLRNIHRARNASIPVMKVA